MFSRWTSNHELNDSHLLTGTTFKMCRLSNCAFVDPPVLKAAIFLLVQETDSSHCLLARSKRRPKRMP